MLLSAVTSRQLIFLGGKGGTGKTTVAAAIAVTESRRGRRVLLVSTDPAHNLGHVFDRSIGPAPVALAPALDAMELDPEVTVGQHLQQTRGFLRKLMPERLRGEIDRHLEQSREAPGMVEAALLESMAVTIEQARADYDLVVFDTAPSGHTARLLALPEMMAAWTEGLLAGRERSERFSLAANTVGQSDKAAATTERDQQIRSVLYRRRERFGQLRDALKDPLATGFFILLTAERLPVLETIELHRQLIDAGMVVPGLIINKRAPLGQGRFLDEMHERERTWIEQLTAALPGLPMTQIALHSDEIVGIEALAALAAHG